MLKERQVKKGTEREKRNGLEGKKGNTEKQKECGEV